MILSKSSLSTRLDISDFLRHCKRENIIENKTIEKLEGYLNEYIDKQEIIRNAIKEVVKY